jgi:hypothetical protein
VLVGAIHFPILINSASFDFIEEQYVLCVLNNEGGLPAADEDDAPGSLRNEEARSHKEL